MIDIATPILIVLKTFWILYWKYILIFLAFVIAGIVIQIKMLRRGRHNKLPTWFNILVGSLTYWLFFSLMTAIAYWIFGDKIIDDYWFTIFNLLAYPMVKLFLKAIGFWYR